MLRFFSNNLTQKAATWLGTSTLLGTMQYAIAKEGERLQRENPGCRVTRELVRMPSPPGFGYTWIVSPKESSQTETNSIKP